MDRRRLHRTDSLLPCLFSLAGKECRGTVVNISLTGARVASADDVPPLDSVLMLTLAPREGEPVVMRGVVVYTKSTSFGLRFDEPRGALMKKLLPILSVSRPGGRKGEAE